MATNITLNPGDHVSLPVPVGTKAGDPVRVGDLNGVAITDRANTSVAPFNADGTPNSAFNAGGGNPNGNASVWLHAAPTFQVTGSNPKPGAVVYFDQKATPRLTLVAAAGLPVFGHVLQTTAGGVTVRILSTSPTPV